MTFDHTTVGDVHVLAPKKNLVGKDETQDLLAAIDEIAEGNLKVIVDLGKISYVNSVGLGRWCARRTMQQPRGLVSSGPRGESYQRHLHGDEARARVRHVRDGRRSRRGEDEGVERGEQFASPR